MDKLLHAMFLDEERQAAAAIGEGEGTASEKINELFAVLDDPLLSAEDVCDLLGMSVGKDDVASALSELVASETLESSSKTQRPFDAEGTVLYRRANVVPERLRLVALEAGLVDGSSRYQFTCNGRLLRSFARISRLDAISGDGNQRREIRKHVENIAQGISNGTQIPNSVLLVFLEELTRTEGELEGDDLGNLFVYIRPRSDWTESQLDSGLSPAQRYRFVEIDIPYRRAAFDGEKPALLVDGQQRTAALGLVPMNEVSTFDLSVNALIQDDSGAKQTFQIANSTQKISTEHANALLAAMDEAPGYLKREKIQAGAVKALALTEKDSPFLKIVTYPGTKKQPEQVVAYNSLFSVAGIFESGSLQIDNEQELTDIVKRSFNLVKKTWPAAWGMKPSASKLMHGAGLRSMASLILLQLEVATANGQELSDEAVWKTIEESLARLTAVVAWTEVDAAAGTKTMQRNWKQEIRERQNTAQDIARLSTFLKSTSRGLDREARKGT